MEGKPLAFGQLSVELLALLPAPDRSGQPVARNCFGPHPACPSLNRLRKYASVQSFDRSCSKSPQLDKSLSNGILLKQRSMHGKKE